MEWMLIVFTLLSVLALFSALALAASMRVMMPPIVPDFSDALRNVPPPYQPTQQEWLAQQRYSSSLTQQQEMK